MKFHLENTSGIYSVRSFDRTGIVVNDQRHTGSLILSANRLTENWPVRHVDDLDESTHLQIAEHGAEIVLLGTGTRHRMIDSWHPAWFAARGMGLEVMDTMAACRTYNILAGELRKVVAALIVDDEWG